MKNGKIIKALSKAKETLAGRFVMGVADTFTGGMVSNVVESTTTHPTGKPDPIKGIGSIVVLLVLIYLVSKGVITVEDAEVLNDLNQ